MNTTENTTHTVVVAEPPSKGLRFLVGLAMLYAFWANRRLIAGFLFSSVAPNAMAPEGFQSVGTITAVVIPLLIDFVVALGGGGIFAATLGWRVFADIAAGTFQMVANWRNGQAVRARVAAAVSQSQASAVQTASATATGIRPPPPQFSDPELARFAAMVQGTLAEIVKRQNVSDELLAGLIPTKAPGPGDPQ
jgi:hypothetical protein